MKHNFYTFIKDESGAVTVDWVVLTAAVIGLGGAVMVSTGEGAMSLANLTSSALSDTIQTTLTRAEFRASYVPLSVFYGDPAMVDMEFDFLNTFTDTEVLNFYNGSYPAYNSPPINDNDPFGVDLLAFTEQVLNERGIGIPDGNLTSVEIRAFYE